MRLSVNTEWRFVMDRLDAKIASTRMRYESISTDAEALPQLRAQLHAYTTLKKELEAALEHPDQ